MNRQQYVSRTTHYRKGHVITQIMTGETIHCPSISAAKRKSREIQKEGARVLKIKRRQKK